MSRARRSIVVYGAYLAMAGLVLALFPNVLLPLIAMPEEHSVWIRLCGCLAFVLGVKGIQNSKAENIDGWRFDNYTRSFAGTFLVVLVLVGIAPRIILVLAVCDYAGALWTAVALHADKQSQRTAIA